MDLFKIVEEAQDFQVIKGSLASLGDDQDLISKTLKNFWNCCLQRIKEQEKEQLTPELVLLYRKIVLTFTMTAKYLLIKVLSQDVLSSVSEHLFLAILKMHAEVQDLDVLQVEVIQCLNRLSCIYERELDPTVPHVLHEVTLYLQRFAQQPTPNGEDTVMAIIEYVLGVQAAHATHTGDSNMTALVMAMARVLMACSDTPMAFELVEGINHVALLALKPEYHELLRIKSQLAPTRQHSDDDSDSSEDIEEESMDETTVLPAYHVSVTCNQLRPFIHELTMMALQADAQSLNLAVGIFSGISAEYLNEEEHVELVKEVIDHVLQQVAAVEGLDAQLTHLFTLLTEVLTFSKPRAISPHFHVLYTLLHDTQARARDWMKAPAQNRQQHKQKQKVYVKLKEAMVALFIQLFKKGQGHVITCATKFWETTNPLFADPLLLCNFNIALHTAITANTADAPEAIPEEVVTPAKALLHDTVLPKTIGSILPQLQYPDLSIAMKKSMLHGVSGIASCIPLTEDQWQAIIDAYLSVIKADLHVAPLTLRSLGGIMKYHVFDMPSLNKLITTVSHYLDEAAYNDHMECEAKHEEEEEEEEEEVGRDEDLIPDMQMEVLRFLKELVETFTIDDIIGSCLAGDLINGLAQELIFDSQIAICQGKIDLICTIIGNLKDVTLQQEQCKALGDQLSKLDVELIGETTIAEAKQKLSQSCGCKALKASK